MAFNKTSVVVPSDGSTGAAQALQFALDLAEELGTPLKILHVLDSLQARMPPGRRLEPEELDAMDPSLARVESIKRAIAAGREALAGRRLDAEQVILVGDPAACILEYLDQCDRPMVVMGRRGLGTLQALVMGSVSQKVSQHARCPVTVVN